MVNNGAIIFEKLIETSFLKFEEYECKSYMALNMEA